MNIVMGVLVVVCLAAAVVLFLALQKPDEFRVTRSIHLNASPAIVFEQVNDLEKGQAWSPWVAMEPQAKYEFSGPKSGEGAALHWEGKKVGKGAMTIVESRPNESVRSRLDFYKPMEGTNTAEFTLTPEEEGTRLTWTMYGPNKFMGKVMSVFMNCEKMVGDQFDQGLSSLKKIVDQ